MKTENNIKVERKKKRITSIMTLLTSKCLNETLFKGNNFNIIFNEGFFDWGIIMMNSQ